VPTVEPRFLDLPGVRLAYRHWGGEGPPVVLLHGLASNSRIWDWTAPLLADASAVVALDQRGHGLSDRPGYYGFDAVTQDLLSAIHALGLDRPVIAGHSWGGSVALAFATEHPDNPRAIVMVDGGFMELSSHTTWDQAEKQMLPPEIDGAPVDRFVEAIRRWPDVGDFWTDELGEMILSNLEVRDGKIYRRLPIPDHMQIARAIYDFPTGERLSSLKVPALAISCERESAGSSDWAEFRRRGIERLQQAAPGVEIVVMQDTIHDVPLQRPAELAALIARFSASP
jgi:pimeloyl-ACP methyl ester carboxylesterase